MNKWSDVDYRLKEWAEWFSANPFGLGYPSKSLEYHMWRGALEFENFIQPEIIRHPRAEEMETFFQRLKEKIPILAAIIKEHYFYPAPIKKHALKLKLPQDIYCRYLEMAHTWIEAQLNHSVKHRS